MLRAHQIHGFFCQIGTNNICLFVIFYQDQCLGSRSGGSPRLPRSGSLKICGSTDPDPRGKNSTHTKKNLLTQICELLKMREYKNFLISEWFIKF